MDAEVWLAPGGQFCEKGSSGEREIRPMRSYFASDTRSQLILPSVSADMPVTRITTIFLDVGGVLLTNGWDSVARRAAVAKFALDAVDFEARHEMAFPGYEAGKSTLNEYLEHTIFYVKRPFSPQEFTEFMYSVSRELPESRAVADRVAATGRYLMAALNNEGAELNDYRVKHFNLRRTFTAFFSSCYVGARKPNLPIYQMALNITQRRPEECLFVDDREPNVEPARQLGMNTIRFENAMQLVADLRKLGIEFPAA